MAFDTMRIRATATMAAVLLCAASLGSAQTATPGQYHNYGAGVVTTCGTWLAERGATDWRQQFWPGDLEWVLGWVSAAGYYNVQGDLRLTDHERFQRGSISTVARTRLIKIKDAAKSLVGELSKPQ